MEGLRCHSGERQLELHSLPARAVDKIISMGHVTLPILDSSAWRVPVLIPTAALGALCLFAHAVVAHTSM